MAGVVTALRRARHPSRGHGKPRLLAGDRDEGHPERGRTGGVTNRPGADDLVRLSSTLTVSETGEIDDARRRLRLPVDEILLAALGRTVAATIGDGAVAVDLGGRGRSVLKPDVDLRRTVGWFTTVYPVALTCATGQEASARQLLDDVRDTLKAVPHYGIGYGLLRYMYAPTARLLGATRPADILFSHVGTIPDLPSGPSDDAPVQFDADTAMPVREARARASVTPSNCGCIAPRVCCIWIGGTTPAGSARQTWNRLPGSSRPRSSN